MISVIIPIYKVEPYLRRCVDSVIKQTYKDLEIILVDDGSPDGCPKICDEYAKTDPRIKVIHKENGGLSSARNAGLDIISGEYVSFVDSDDYIHPKMIEILYNEMIKSRTLASSVEYKRIYTTDVCSIFQNPEDYCIFTTDEEYINDNYFEVIFNVIWGKLYDSSVWNNLRFPEGMIYEDEYLKPALMDRINFKYAFIKKPLYYYYNNPNGESKSLFSEKRLDKIKAIFQCLIYYKQHKNHIMCKKLRKYFVGYFFTYMYRAENCGYTKSAKFKEALIIYKKIFIDLIFDSNITIKYKKMFIYYYISHRLSYKHYKNSYI